MPISYSAEVEFPIAQLMRRLLTGYVVSFNRRHRRHGHLLQNRYKSIVCQEDTYFMQLIGYIHLNPLRAGIVLEFQGERMIIKPLCYAPENAVIQYKLWVKKTGRSGKSDTYQSGSVRLQQGEEKYLAQSRLAIFPEDQYQIKLEVYKEGNLIAEDQVSHP